MENKTKNNNEIFKSDLKAHVIRLLPDTDLFEEIKLYINRNKINAATILTCVGSLKKINIRTYQE